MENILFSFALVMRLQGLMKTKEFVRPIERECCLSWLNAHTCVSV